MHLVKPGALLHLVKPGALRNECTTQLRTHTSAHAPATMWSKCFSASLDL